MISKYLVLKERVAKELEDIKQVVEKTTRNLGQVTNHSEEQDVYIDSVALNLLGFYTGIEHIFEVIATEIDGSIPSGSRWHKDLLEQMSLSIPQIRPALISQETEERLLEFLSFRHLVRNVYTFNLDIERVERLVKMLGKTFQGFLEEIDRFLVFLKEVGESN